MKRILFPLLILLVAAVVKGQTPVQITTIPGNNFVYVGSLERADNDVSNSQKIIIKIWGGSWFSDSNGETSFYISNRSGLNVVQTNVGPYSEKKIALKAYKNGTKTDFYLVPNPNEYTSFAVNSFSYGHTLDSKFVQIALQSSPPALPEVSFAIVPSLMTDGDGNVGIGAPAVLGQKLSVNGNIRAREIKVETANWPDYIFNEEYRVPSLEEVDEFIQSNKHLPGVPKAEIVEKEGYSLSDMDKVLLKKIEEMTLQLIQLNETVKKQAAEIAKMRKL